MGQEQSHEEKEEARRNHIAEMAAGSGRFRAEIDADYDARLKVMIESELAFAAAAKITAVHKATLVRSSKGDHAPKQSSATTRQPFVSDSDDEDGGDPEPGEILAKWGARKQPRDTARTADSEQSISPDGLADFSNDMLAEPAYHAPKSVQKAPSDFFRGSRTAKPRAAEASSTVRPPNMSSQLREAPSSSSTLRSPNASMPSRLPTVPASVVPTKRTSTSAFADERRPSASKAPKVPRQVETTLRPKSSDQQGQAVAAEAVPPTTQERPPKWYTDLKAPAMRDSNEKNADGLLVRLKDAIRKCSAGKANLVLLFTTIRELLHNLVFAAPVSAQLLKRLRVLHNQDGLPQLFDKKFDAGVAYPWDIRADARELYNKWYNRDFETDIFRGIDPGQPASKNSKKKTDRILPTWEGRTSAKFHGNGLLLNGQWWPSQLTAVRDGAHGATIAGITGAEGKGAYSCIMSGGHDYPDRDDGDVVLYCGTDSTDGSVTGPTHRMLESVQSAEPVRLIRSHNLRSEFAPEIGFRYDGLYNVVSAENMDGATSTRQRHRFRLERVPHQDPIRGGTGPEKRPTEQEKAACKQDKRFRGY